MESGSIDSEDLWRRVGLEELRQALVRAQDLMARFEQALHALPPCNACARVRLLERIDTTGRTLSAEAGSLAVLAVTLKHAVAVAEQAQAEMEANTPTPCQCSSGPCTCHE